MLIPLHCEYFALEGLADLVSTMRRVRAALNPALDIEGVLLTMFDERTNLGQQVATDVRGFFKEKVFRTVIPRNVRLGEAPSHGLPVVLYDVKSRGAEAYLALAREVMERGARNRRVKRLWRKDPLSAKVSVRSFRMLLNRARRRWRSTSIASCRIAFSRAHRWTTRGSTIWRARSKRTA